MQIVSIGTARIQNDKKFLRGFNNVLTYTDVSVL